MKLFVLKALFCTVVTCSQVTLAADLYHCGNNYQDLPCKNSVSSKPVSKKTSPVTNNSAANEKKPAMMVDADCKKRGEAAKEIARIRESGKTVDQQIKVAPDATSRDLIQDVYNHRGSPLYVQNTIEHECMQVKEKDRLTKNQRLESEKLRNDGNPSSASSTTNKTKLHPQAAMQKEDTKKEASNYKENQGDELGICRAFKSGLDNIADQKRAGGDAEHMQDLTQQQNKLTQEMKTSGC